MHRSTNVFSSFLLGLAAASCAPEGEPFLWEDHCANQNGNAWCAERYGDGSRPFCVWGTCGPTPGLDGCVAQPPADEACYSPCGGEATVLEDATCLGGSGSSAGTADPSEGSTTGIETADASTVGTTCQQDADCSDPAAPFCEPGSGVCMSCEAIGDPSACATLDPAQPVCADGLCVQCTAATPEACSGNTPVCDDATNTCVGCTQHADCGEAACNLFTGACLPADAVVHVGPGQEFTTLGAAVDDFGPDAEGTLVIHEAGYFEAVTVDQNRVLAFVAADGAQPTWDTPMASMAPQLTVVDATVLLDGLVVAANGVSATPAISTDGGRAWLERSRVVDNNGGAIATQNGSELVLRNCFIGGDVSDKAAIDISGSTANVLYSTVAAGFGMASAIRCDPGSTVEVRSAILVARTDDPEVQCGSAMIDHCATESDFGGTNTTVGPVELPWFADYAGGDFHLDLVPALLVNAGEWQQGDPAVDIDGDARSGIDGAPDVPGADVPSAG